MGLATFDSQKVASPMGLATFDLRKVASPMGLAIFKGSQDRLKELVIGSGQSHGTGHF